MSTSNNPPSTPASPAPSAPSTISAPVAHGFDGARGAAALLLAAIVSALLVVANQVIDTWTEGHLLAAWIVMWTVAFAALALFAARPAALAVACARRRPGPPSPPPPAPRKPMGSRLTDARVTTSASWTTSQPP